MSEQARFSWMGSLLTALLSVLLAVSVVHCGDDRAPPAVDSECQEDEDCAGGRSCFEGLCVTPCNSNDDCRERHRCAGGLCLPEEYAACDRVEDCPTSMMYAPECFTVACEAGWCSYTVAAEAPCGEPYCRLGVSHQARRCGDRGACDSDSLDATSCGGFTCDESGTSCLTACQGPGDCLEGYTCEEGACTTTLQEVGEPCSAGEPCVPTAVCLEGSCHALDGQPCAADAACESGICINGLCADNPSEVFEPCDGQPDCAEGLLCVDSYCRRTLGSICGNDRECSDGNCECDDSPCASRTCAAADCVCGYGVAGECTWRMDGVADPEDCDAGGRLCDAGDCLTQ